eukprot:gb/GFBE01035066.1/.p1 GENE.gb/GFBE01035066.1/~~gb/GFBE01035066.1/.p1  ORF type:complete len:120 (+),score=12.46 gb/GFBE01035066.1/:1-360(+)
MMPEVEGPTSSNAVLDTTNHPEDDDHRPPSRTRAYKKGDPLWAEALSLLEVLGHHHGQQRAEHGNDCTNGVEDGGGDQEEDPPTPRRSWAVVPGKPELSEVLRFLPPEHHSRRRQTSSQ